MAQNQKGNAQARQPMITTGKLSTEIGRENRESEVHSEEQRQGQGRESQEGRPACSGPECGCCVMETPPSFNCRLDSESRGHSDIMEPLPVRRSLSLHAQLYLQIQEVESD